MSSTLEAPPETTDASSFLNPLVIPVDTPSIIVLIYSSSVAIKTLDNVGVKIGSKIIKKSDKFYCEGSEIIFSRELSFKVIVRLE